MFLGIVGPNQTLLIVGVLCLLFGKNYILSGIKKFNKEKDELTKPIKDIKRDVNKMKRF